MPITVPVTGSPIASVAFGIPVANAINNLRPVRGLSSASLTLSTTLTDIAGATISWTSTVPETVFIAYVFDFLVSTTGVGLVVGQCLIDAGIATQVLYDVGAGVGRATVGNNTIANLAAGAHTAKLRASKANAGGAVQAVTPATNLILIRIPQ